MIYGQEELEEKTMTYEVLRRHEDGTVKCEEKETGRIVYFSKDCGISEKVGETFELDPNK